MFFILQQINLNRVLLPNCIAIDINNVKCILSNALSTMHVFYCIHQSRQRSKIRGEGGIRVLSGSCSATVVVAAVLMMHSPQLVAGFSNNLGCSQLFYKAK